MSDVPSNVKPLTLTTGRVIFAIAGIYVTQSLVSALSMQSLPCLLYTSPSPRDRTRSRMPSSA